MSRRRPSYYGKALSPVIPNNAALMERAMLHKIAAGEVSEGIALARRYEQISPGHHLGVTRAGDRCDPLE